MGRVDVSNVQLCQNQKQIFKTFLIPDFSSFATHNHGQHQFFVAHLLEESNVATIMKEACVAGNVTMTALFMFIGNVVNTILELCSDDVIPPEPLGKSHNVENLHH
jgi:hypothetical protein